MTTPKRKLIEVALPLEAINRESAREKSIRHGHPSTLHLWWARRPLAACRAVLFAQLVDDPSSHPEKFPTEEEQTAERKRLFELIERLVVWENSNDEGLLDDAHKEILKSTGGKPPKILDPFAGGGSIPLEAQRLGLEVEASDLNPVAVLINKALIEIPPKWAGQPPVYPGAAEARLGAWPRATGLAEDVRRYGQWMRDEAERRVGHLYPKATLADGSEADVIAWIWARTVTCPNPACGAEIPLVSSWWLSKKRDRPTWLQPIVNGKNVTFQITVDKTRLPDLPPKRGRGARFACLVCDDTTTDAYVKAEALDGRMSSRLVAVVAQGLRQRVYLPATPDHEKAAEVERPADVPDELISANPRWFSPPAFGFTTFADLFTNRQLVSLTTFIDVAREVRDRVASDARMSARKSGSATEYANAVALYLAIAVSRSTSTNSALCRWRPDSAKESVNDTFSRQSLPMIWDFAEGNIFVAGPSSPLAGVGWISKVLERLHLGPIGHVEQQDASTRTYMPEAVVCTDPPYYDNIGYSDLSDYFYVWLRRTLPQGDLLTATMLTPKTEELVSIPYRFSGSATQAKIHFEQGFIRTFANVRQNHRADIPVIVFYAFKQSESDDSGTASTGWEKMLNGLMNAGLSITATWPIRTELSNRMIGSGTNALASSIVMACRPKPAVAEAVTRRAFLVELRRDLPEALRELQQGSVAPVDLAQAAIGPGMAAFSRCAKVVEADGSDMTVRTALALINHALDEVLAEQEGDFDADTRFCVKWFGQFGWNDASSGEADVLARATNTSVAGLVRGGVFHAVAGKARLLGPEDLEDAWDALTDERVSDWEVVVRLAKALDERGAEAASDLMRLAGQRRDLDTVKELAYLLFSLAEKKGWTQTAILFNGLGTSWNDLESAARAGAGRVQGDQGAFSYDVDDET